MRHARTQASRQASRSHRPTPATRTARALRQPSAPRGRVTCTPPRQPFASLDHAERADQPTTTDTGPAVKLQPDYSASRSPGTPAKRYASAGHRRRIVHRHASRRKPCGLATPRGIVADTPRHDQPTTTGAQFGQRLASVDSEMARCCSMRRYAARCGQRAEMAGGAKRIGGVQGPIRPDGHGGGTLSPKSHRFSHAPKSFKPPILPFSFRQFRNSRSNQTQLSRRPTRLRRHSRITVLAERLKYGRRMGRHLEADRPSAGKGEVAGAGDGRPAGRGKHTPGGRTARGDCQEA